MVLVLKFFQHMKKLWQRILFWVKRIVLFFFLSTLVMVIVYSFLRVPVTPLMLIRWGEGVIDGKSVGIHKTWKPIGEISQNMVQAVVASEDNRFEEHFGFDLDAIERARKHNERSKRKHGASTITQQTVKNVFLWPGRTWVRKGLEAYFTILVEVFWSKERIMEVYLNVIEMGPGTYGAEAASQKYFGKRAKKLTRGEAALIAAALPDPRRRNPAKPSAYMQRRQGQILRNMNNIKKVKFDE